jgi:hypothetical protein
MGTGGRLIPRTGLVLTEHPWIWPQSTPTALLAWHFSGVHAAIPVRARKPFTRLGDGEGRAAVRGDRGAGAHFGAAVELWVAAGPFFWFAVRSLPPGAAGRDVGLSSASGSRRPDPDW